MVRFLDREDKQLRKGFYRFYHEGQLFYFTGKYDSNKNNVPIFKNEYNNVENFISQCYSYANFTKNLSRVDKKEVKEIVKMISKRENFLEKSLEELRR